ncbi:hypothetical protein ACROYT_G007207 [Oculina patagonica]
MLAGIVLAGQAAHARNYVRTRQRRTVPYEVEVTTGIQEGAGTDANVFITIYGSNGQSQEKKLKGNLFENNFEKGKVDNFVLQIMDVGEILKIKIRHDNSLFMPAWNLAKIRIVAPGGKEYDFPCNCELKTGALSKELFPAGQPSNLVNQALGGCNGVFQDASHCWPFNEAQDDSSPDLKGNFPARLMDGAKIVDSVIRKKAVSTLEKSSWIDLGNFKGRCIGNPDLCTDGVTMIFWAKINAPAVSDNPGSPKYVFSSGGEDSRSRGFSLFHQNGMFVLRAVAAQKKWKITIENDKIPLNFWFSFAFTWKAGSGLRYFINGQEAGFKLQSEPLSVASGTLFNDLKISKPNDNNLAEEILPLKFDQFVTWSRVLQSDEISKAFNEGGALPADYGQGNPFAASAACQPNPCQNGGQCQLDPDSPEGHFCQCPPQFSGAKCEIRKDEQPTQAATTAAPTTAAGSTNSSPGPTTGGPTTGGPTTKAPSTGRPTTGAGSTPTGATTGQPTTSVGSSTSGGSTQVPPTTAAPTGPVPDMKQLVMELMDQINLFRRLHQSPDVSPSEDLNQEASKWAQQVAAQGSEKIDPNSTYGQLVCSHHTASDLAKACAVKWYGAIKFFDWADPKLTVKSSPFTQLVWKNSTRAGVGIAKGAGGAKRQSIGGKYYIAVLFDPGQSDEGNIKENVLPATGISQPAPEASCPEGYSKLPMGRSRSCFTVRTTAVSWDDALLGCALDNGTLASLDSREEATLVVSLLTKSNVTEAWIGLNDRSTEGRYVWVDGSPIPFSEWLPGEPDGNEAENCVVQSKSDYGPGWADKHCFDSKAFVCEVPVPGYTFYKFSVYSGGYYSMCTPVIQNVNDLLRETITRYFQEKNIVLQPIVNTIRCMPNGVSHVEVIIRLGPNDSSDTIGSLQTSIKENDGELELSNGASAKLISVEILPPGSSYCPNQCVSTTCQAGCDPSCCTQSLSSPAAAVQYPSPMAYQPEPIYNTNTNPWQCPLRKFEAYFTMRGALAVIFLSCVILTLLELFHGSSPSQTTNRRRRTIYDEDGFPDDDYPDDDDDEYGDDDDSYDGDDEEYIRYRRQQQQQRRYYRQS